MSDLAAQRRRAAEMAYRLGIAFWVAPDGRINSDGVGERIEPAKGAVPLGHGHGRGAEAKTQP